METRKKPSGKKGETCKGGWYMDKNGKIPLEEFFKDDPKSAGPKRSEVLKAQGLFPFIEIVDMREVMK